MARKKRDPKMRFHFYRFLNLPGHHSTGYIAAHLEETEKGHYSRSVWNNCRAWLAFKDCDREITFDIECGDDAEFENSLHKLDTMIEGLKGLRKALTAENRKRIREREENPPKDEVGED